MESVTPHGVINNAHGSRMPMGRSHPARGGSIEYIQPTGCRRCEELKAQGGKCSEHGGLSTERPAPATTGNGWTPLCIAASEDDVCKILELVQLNHDVNHETRLGMMPLKWILVNDWYRFGDTALLVAAAQDKCHAISALVRCGVNLFHETRFGETPLIKVHIICIHAYI